MGEIEVLAEGLPGGTLQTSGGGSFGFGEQSETDVSLALRGAMDGLWEHRTVTVTARYARLPGITRSRDVQVYGVPGDNIAAFLFADQESLNTDAIDVQMEVGNRAGGEVDYQASTMGEWSGEVGASTRDPVDGSSISKTPQDNPGVVGLTEAATSDGERVYLDGRMSRTIGAEEKRSLRATDPVTPSQVLEEGGATFDVPPGDEPARMLRGVATIESPDGLYQRRIETNPVTIQVLEGNPIDPEVLARRTSGPAPYRTIINLRLDRMGRDALGKVEWLTRPKGGDQWQTVKSGDQLTRFDHTFEAGGYELRARLHNRHTGATSETRRIAISAYRELDLEVTGGSRTFPGKSLELEATPKIGDQAFDGGEVEWQINGETVATGRTFRLERDETTGVRVTVRARAPEAPADDPDSWTEVRHAVRVSRPRAPRVRIDGPDTVDFKESGEYRTHTRMPYPGMSREQFPVRGHWVLPDGSKLDGESVKWSYRGESVQGRKLEYSPTAADSWADWS